MIESVESQRVVVTKAGSRALGKTTHNIYHSSFKERPDGTRQEFKGSFIAVGVRLDSGHDVYANPEQISIPVQESIDLLIANEAIAAQKIADIRGIVYNRSFEVNN